MINTLFEKVNNTENNMNYNNSRIMTVKKSDGASDKNLIPR